MIIGILITMLRVKRDFSPESFRVLLSDIIFPLVFMSHSASNSQGPEVSKLFLRFHDVRDAIDSS